MNSDSIRTFLLLAEVRNFTKTAELMSITQSTVTTRIRSLEEELGVTLFTRNKRSVALTEVGQRLFPFLLQSSEMLEKSREVADAFHSNKQLSFGAVHSIWPAIIPAIFKQSHQRETRMDCRTGHSVEIIEWVLKGIIDLGFAYVEPDHSRLDSFVAAKKRLLLVEHASLRAHQPFLYLSWGQTFDQWFDRHHSLAQKQITVDQYSLLIDLLDSQLGRAYIPEEFARSRLAEGTWREVGSADLEPPELVVYGLHLKNSAKQETFLHWKNEFLAKIGI